MFHFLDLAFCHALLLENQLTGSAKAVNTNKFDQHFIAEESVLDRHWKEMFERMGDSAPKPAVYGNDYKKVTLKMMLEHEINEFTQDFEELSTAAAKQHGLKKAMGNMKAG